MLAQIEPARNDFHALAEYLIHGKERPTHPDRVAWCFGWNLATDDPLLAAHYMTATAEFSKRCREPCYHASINWDPDEQPTPEIMQEIARRTLDMAGLGEHQALVMGHGDKPHKHLHLMINRVHPDTGRAWSTSHDYRRFDKIMKQLSDEYGFRYVPPHSFHPDLTDDLPKAPNSNATYAAKRGAPTDRMQWSAEASREFGAAISENLDRASSWEDIEAAVAEHGLTLEAKGQGLAIGDTTGYTKFSKLGLEVTANGLAKRFGTPPPRPLERQRPPPRPRWDTNRITVERDRLHWLLDGCATWDELEHRLAINGLSLQPKGKGFVMADPTGEIALSMLGWSKPKLEAKFANPLELDDQSPEASPHPRSPRADRRGDQRLDRHPHATPSPRRSPPISKVQAWAARNILTVDAVDIVRAIGSKDELRAAINDAVRQRKARLASKPLMVQLMEELNETLRNSTLLQPSTGPSRRKAGPKRPKTEVRER